MMLRTAIAKLFPFLLATAVFFLGVASDHFFATLSPNALFRIADDFVVAIVLGCVVLLYERRRRRNLKAQLEIIREMNHHVRNALQIISLTTLQQDDESVRIMLRESVTRIDWALREVLPGKRIAVRERLRARRSATLTSASGLDSGRSTTSNNVRDLFECVTHSDAPHQ